MVRVVFGGLNATSGCMSGVYQCLEKRGSVIEGSWACTRPSGGSSVGAGVPSQPPTTGAAGTGLGGAEKGSQGTMPGLEGIR